MIRKLRQQLEKHTLTTSNRTPNIRSRKFMLNWMRQQRRIAPSAPLRGAMGFTQWQMAVKFAKDSRIAHRAACFITGRARGTTKRIAIARTKVKAHSEAAQLPGVQKSSF